jgi:hypothetical protein
MKNTVFWGLLVLNLVLLAGLLAPYMRGNEAMAQRGGGGRRPELLMIPGEVVGQASHVVYLVDTANRRLGAVALNQRGVGLDSLAPQDLDRIFEDRGPVRGGADAKKKP